jgi:hypothetical protein
MLTFSVQNANIGERAMTDRALANAQKRRDEIAARINQLVQELEVSRKELSSVEGFIAEWHRFADSAGAVASNTGVNSSYPQSVQAVGEFELHLDSNGAPTPTPKNPGRIVVGIAAQQIIQALGRPVPRTELFSELAKQGVHIHGKDPEMVLSTMLWRMPHDFIRLPHHGYWIRKEPFPAANYTPTQLGEQDSEEISNNIDVIENGILDPASVSDA